MQGILQDIRYAVRVLRAHTGFTLIAIVTLALGIGATSAMFSIANTVLFQPLPYAQPERLVRVWEFDRLRDSPREGLSGPDYLDLAARQRVFESLTAFTSAPQTLTQRGGEPERVVVSQVTQSFFGVLGRRPALGRTFSAEEDRTSGPRVAVLSAGFWTRRFASNPDVIGQTVTIDGVDHTIVGIFTDPLRFPAEDTDVWTPARIDYASFARGRHLFGAVARLRSGVTLERARADLTAIGLQLESEFAADNKGRGFAANLLHLDSTRNVRTALLVLLGAVGAVLLITCANIASLLLSRAVSRIKEVSIRSALGAGSWRVVRQFIVEGVMLSCIAGIAGLGVAYLSLDALMTFAPANLPRAADVGIDTRVATLVAAIALLTGILFGVVPALQTLREDLQGWLKEQARGSGAGRASHRLRRVLVIAEIAMSAALLIGAALLIKSFWRLQTVDPGFNAEHVLKVQFTLPASRYPQDFSKFPDWPEVHAFHDQLMDRVRQAPGVRAAGLALAHPLQSGFTSSFYIVGRPDAGPGTREEIRIRAVSPGYFATVGVPLMRGRWLDDRDRLGQPKVTLINESAARRHFPGEDPIGKQMHIFGGPYAYTIVGIVGNERFMGLDQEVPPAVYPPIAQIPMTGLSLLVRGDGDPAALTAAIRREFREIDPALALYGVDTMTSELRRTTAQPRFSSALVGAFAAMAWLLAIIGVHGVLSYSVAQRVQEIGVRMALGAEPRDVLHLVMREGIVVASIGLAAGLALAFASSRVLSTMLYAVEPRDVTVFAGVAVSLLATALLASYLPARRATRVDPISALRAE
jgi:putative ABC transport system permease protein